MTHLDETRIILAVHCAISQLHAAVKVLADASVINRADRDVIAAHLDDCEAQLRRIVTPPARPGKTPASLGGGK